MHTITLTSRSATPPGNGTPGPLGIAGGSTVSATEGDVHGLVELGRASRPPCAHVWREYGSVLFGPTKHSHQPVIEIGCGPPDARQLDTAESSIGVDIDLQALRTTPSARGQRHYVCADALTLPFQSSTCDLLILRAVLHHLVPTDRALREMMRVLSPNGRLQITDGVALSSDDAATLDAELRARSLPTEPTYGYDLDELSATVTEVGLEVVDIQVGGRSTFATPPFVSRTYSTKRFTLTAQRTTTG